MRAGPLRSVLGLWLAAVGSAQTAAERFDEQLALVEAAGHAERSALAGEALDRFLRLEQQDRTGRLTNGAWVAVLAGDHSMALQLAALARESVVASSGRLVWTHLTALLLSGQLQAFVEQARRDDKVHHASVDELQAVLEVVREHERELLPAADGLLQAGQVSDGIWLFEALARCRPGEAVPLANFALALRHLGRTQEAGQAYLRALELAPGDEQIWNDYGLFLRGSSRPAKALATFEKSYQLDNPPGAGPAITNLVQVELREPGLVRPDPLLRAAAALQVRPDSVMLRRVTLDLILARAERGQSPDKDPEKR
ncbi:MAG: hypothetical protein VYE77_09445 [Planctomycetota bacterium]|nr:hypothetical protein [Planctomycetota bacterium]